MLSLRLNWDREALVTVTLSSGGFRKTNHAMPPATAAAMKMIAKVRTSFWFRFMAEKYSRIDRTQEKTVTYIHGPKG